MTTFRSNGKLLITGEYVVLDGAKALAIPTQFGQQLTIEKNNSDSLHWKSYDNQGALWFEDTFRINSNDVKIASERELTTASRLIQILKSAQILNPEFLKTDQGYTVTTHLDFDRHWGLGTSSTLINNISNWANVDAYQLLAETFGGSGYDIACAQSNTPITYQLPTAGKPIVETVNFNPDFRSHLYFVYLNQKQNSREGIKAYKALGNINQTVIDAINHITEQMVDCTSISKFEELITSHEAIISELIQQPTVKSEWFNDFEGCIKSLGAWGGDFVLVTSTEDPSEYFRSKGFETIMPFNQMIRH